MWPSSRTIPLRQKTKPPASGVRPCVSDSMDINKIKYKIKQSTLGRLSKSQHLKGVALVKSKGVYHAYFFTLLRPVFYDFKTYFA